MTPMRRSLVLGCGRAPALLRSAETPSASPLCRALAPSIASSRCAGASVYRFCSSQPDQPRESEAPPSDKPALVYEGAKNKIVITLKTLSIANLGFAVVSAPILQYITAAHGNSGKGTAMAALVRATLPRPLFSRAREGGARRRRANSLTRRLAARAQLLFFGGGTTGALTWATSTYVLKMYSVPGKDSYTITTPTLTGGTKETEVAWEDVTRPLGYHPFSTFEAAGKMYYLDELGEMHDESFPEKLEEALNR